MRPPPPADLLLILLLASQACSGNCGSYGALSHSRSMRSYILGLAASARASTYEFGLPSTADCVYIHTPRHYASVSEQESCGI
eukprot:5267579-Pyramimonas_sp.AAC.1